MSEPLRFAMSGVGGTIFPQHRSGVQAVDGVFAGMMDIDATNAQARADEAGCPLFDNFETMLTETKPDVVSIMTPHPSHAEQTIMALEAGCHVLVEKPMADHVGAADAMIETAQRTGRVLAINFQQRLRPEIRAAQNLIETGQLGEIQNADMKMTWTRTAVYYGLSSWRGTWRGEGGGVLLNQAPHELDLLCLLLGMPSRVMAWTRNLLHDIETEDTLHAIVEWPNGALAGLHISTAEAGQPQRFEIIGTGGHLALGPGQISFKRFDTDMRDFIQTSQKPFSAPELAEEPVTVSEDSTGNHDGVYRHLRDHLQNGAPLLLDPQTGIRGLELANAMNYASRTGETVEFPLDRGAYLDLLTELRKEN